MRAAVKKVAEYFPTAIISGRSRDKVVAQFYMTLTIFFLFLFLFIYFMTTAKSHRHCPIQASLSVIGFDSDFGYTLLAQVHEFVGLTELYYAGSHGMDIIGPVRQSVSDNHPNCIIRSTDKQKQVLEFKVSACRLLLNFCLLSTSIFLNGLYYDLSTYRVRKLIYSNLLLNSCPWLMR